MLIGTRIKELRKNKKMTLAELSKKSGVQIASLSRIENLKMTGTLESHMRIARALGLDLPSLYKEASPPPEQGLASSGSHGETFQYNARASYEILATNILQKKMMPVILTIEEGGKSDEEQNAAGSERFLFVLQGKVKICVGEKGFELGRNHTLYFDASHKHHFENIGKGTAKIISVTTPVVL